MDSAGTNAEAAPSSVTRVEKVHDATAPKKVVNKNKKRTKLIRPRGKRGGVKNRKPIGKGSDKESGKKTGQPLKVVKDEKVDDMDNPSSSDVEDEAASPSASDSPAVEAPTAHSLQISHFHALLKEMNQSTVTPERRLAIEDEIASLGGLEAYQDASLIGADKTKGGESGKWCAAALQDIVKANKHEGKVRLLDVGALGGTAYTAYGKWIETTSIDLNPRGENVQQYDFFDYPVPKDDEDKFDVVALSLVLNFVGDLTERGELLLHAHNYLSSSGGYLYLVLPLPCVANSRYLDHSRLEEILDSTGWELIKNGDSKKLTRWLLKSKLPNEKKVKGGKQSKAQGHPYWDGQVWKKEEIRISATANNFCIKVRTSGGEGGGSGGGGSKGGAAAVKKRKVAPSTEKRERKSSGPTKRDAAFKSPDRKSPGGGKGQDARAGRRSGASPSHANGKRDGGGGGKGKPNARPTVRGNKRRP